MEWISVKDKYPQNKQKVKIKVIDTNNNEHELDSIFTNREDFRSWKITPPHNIIIHAKPTHWMPLPELPND